MAPKGGTFFLLLIASLSVRASAEHPDLMPGRTSDLKDMTRQLMMKCKKMGHPAPTMRLLRTVFNSSDLPVDDRSAEQSDTLLSGFLDVLNSVSPGGANKDPLSRVPWDGSDKMTKMWNCTKLQKMIRLMRNSSGASACYMRAVLAPLSWATLTKPGTNNMDSEDYDTLLWAAKPVLLNTDTSKRVKLPPRVEGRNMKNMMKMLQEEYDSMSEDQKSQVEKWEKEQIAQNYFNCTRRPSSDPRSASMPPCKPSVKWLTVEVLTMMGPFLSHLTPDDVDSSPKEKLCEFFRSDKFKSAMSSATRMKPSLGSKFLQRIQECFNGQKEFAENVDKLGPLACHYSGAPDLTSDRSWKLLSQLAECSSPRSSELKKRLLKSAMSTSNGTDVQALRKLGGGFTLLSPSQLSTVPSTDLKEVLKNLGPNVRWTKAQLRTLVKKQLGDKKCEEVSGGELMALGSVVEGVPICVLKNVKAKEILKDAEGLKNMSMRMKRGQLKAMLQRLHESGELSELVGKLPGPLLQRVSLNNLDKANIVSLDQVENKPWSRPQAALLAKKLHDLKQLQYRKLHSVLQGVTCNMIDKAADKDILDMAQSLEEAPQWLSKVQARCAARKLLATLEKKRPDYFKTITEEELNDIPTNLILHLSPSQVENLPDSVCAVFIDKMEVANLSSLPLRCPSRPALARRALLCLANGTDLSGLTVDSVSRLGPLLCELHPSQLSLMARDVLTSSLQDMASCEHIPQRHRAALILLVKQTFGDPSDWSADTMESLGPLLLLDDDAVSSLPNKPWMKDVLYFLKSRLSRISDALRKKVFDLTTRASDGAPKKRRAVDSRNPVSGREPTTELIEELGMDNVYWRAEQLDRMSAATFGETVERFGAISGYNTEQLVVLRKKVTEVFGSVSRINESGVMQMGCIARGFSNNSDLENLPFPLDTLEDIAHCGWTESQMEPLWKGVAKRNNLTAQQLGAVEMVALNQFICGLSNSEISQLNTEAFKDAVGSMQDVQCSYKVSQQLKRQAVSAFGNTSTWTGARVAELGNMIAGLDKKELASLDVSAFSFLSETCIPLIPPDNLAALSVAQIEALGPDNADMVTSKQRAALGDVQVAALERTATGTRDGTPTVEAQSGAPSVTVEGISAFMKPILFLLMGLLLL